jgi:diguanylate cyclase (GGDEF)-like protein
LLLGNDRQFSLSGLGEELPINLAQIGWWLVELFNRTLARVYFIFSPCAPKFSCRSAAVKQRMSLKGTRELASNHLVTSCAALAALFLFVPTGQRIIASLVEGSATPGIDRPLAIGFILNIAVILFAWRRSKDLQNALAANALAEQSAHDNAFVDHVTGLANRRELTRVLADPTRARAGSKLLLLDLDFFKKVNDVHGHVVGDEVLKRVAEIIRCTAPDGSCCARLGGDEFAVLIPNRSDDEVGQCVTRILKAIAEPLALQTATAHVSASVGISRIEAAANGEDCLRRSDIAMYAAKRAGRNRQIWFDRRMECELLARTQLEDEIRNGVAGGEFVPFYQPQMDLETGKLIGFEVLARWQHKVKGLLEPAEFMTVAEASGLISELSLSVMKQALNEARNWPGEVKIAVNISPIQFRDSQLAERILKLLSETGFPPSRLEVEITESSFLEDRETALTIVESLKNMGVTISLDDFGTGYASLSQLQSLPFDRIKIDKSFVSSLLSDSQSDAIVSTILSLGRALKLPITAEGIEDDGTKERLCRLGCSDGQGWLFGKAVSADIVRETFGIEEASEVRPTREEPVSTSNERRDHHRRAAGRGRAR